jgi:hypothetical protein
MLRFRALVAGLCLLTGCSHLTARKVSVESRLTECDREVHGFRYYLSRPYLVVSQQVSLGSEIKVGTLGWFVDDHGSKSELVLACVGPTGGPEYYRTNGEPFHAVSESFVRLKPKAEPAKPDPNKPDPNKPDPNNPDPNNPDPNNPDPNKPDPNKPPTGQDVPTASLLRRRTSHPGSSDSADAPAQQIGAIRAVSSQTDGIIKLGSAGGLGATMSLPNLIGAATAENAAAPNTQAISIVMLPDFEEQMAIDDCNGAAYSTYSLRFKNGWELATVNGSWDATAVPVDILKVLGNAIQAAQDTKLAEMKADATAAPTPQKDVALAADTNVVRAVLIYREFIAPGMYKLLKNEERSQNASSQGYFSDLGIPSMFETTVRLISSE